MSSQKLSKGASLSKGVALFDLHYPDHNRRLLENVTRYLGRHRFDYIVYGGDTLDMGCISRHAIKENNWGALEGKRLKDDYRGMSTILRTHRRLQPKAEIYYLRGNHQEWVDEVVRKLPSLEGLLEEHVHLPLEEVGAKIIAPRKHAKIGKLHFIHGDVFGKYVPVFHSKKVVELYNRNVVYGDRHQYQSYVKASPIDLDDKHGAWCIPTMGNLNPRWAKDRPNNWVNGFAVFYILGSKFSVYPIISVDGNFISPEGERYGL